jgi:hypothetical protein
MEHPALCTGCKALYPSGVEGDAASRPVAAPCPGCGEVGYVPDGVDSFIRHLVEHLSAPERSLSEIERLSVIFVAAMQSEAAFAHVGDTIKESLPPLSPVADMLPAPSAERYVFISLSLKSIVLFISELGRSDDPTVDVHQVLNVVYEEEAASLSTLPHPPPPEEGAKVGRNDPCPCGSGKKYKKCCL